MINVLNRFSFYFIFSLKIFYFIFWISLTDNFDTFAILPYPMNIPTSINTQFKVLKKIISYLWYKK